MISLKYSFENFSLVIDVGFTSEYHVVEEDDDCRPNTVELCVSSTGQIEKPIPFYVKFYSGSAKGLLYHTE